MKSLRLPKFDIPDLPPKRLTPKAYQAWVLDNLKHLHANGRLERLCRQANRCPVAKRFVLDSD